MGFKKSDLKKCAMCGNGLMHTGIPIFYKLRIEPMGFDSGAIQRTNAIEQYFGGEAGPGIAIANAMGPNEDLAKPLGEPVELLICQPCGVTPEMYCLLELIEGAKNG